MSARLSLVVLSLISCLAACDPEVGDAAGPTTSGIDGRDAFVQDLDPGALAGFRERLTRAGEIRDGRLAQGHGGAALQSELSSLIAATEDFSEAALLVRVALQPDKAPPVSPGFATDIPNSDWEFVDWAVVPPQEIAAELDLLRNARDEALSSMSREDATDVRSTVESLHDARLVMVAASLGLQRSPRPAAYHVEFEGQVWRRLKDESYFARLPKRGGSGPGAPPSVVPGETAPEQPPLTPVWDDLSPTRGEQRAILPTNSPIDGRWLRSEYNGYDMQSSVWRPKGAIVPDTSNPNGNPLDSRCTGTKISERVVVTAAHCMNKNGSSNNFKRWFPGADGIHAYWYGTGDPSPNGYHTSYKRTTYGGWYEHNWDHHDMGVFVLYNNTSACNGYWHGWDAGSDDLYSKTYFLFGYPGAHQGSPDVLVG